MSVIENVFITKMSRNRKLFGSRERVHNGFWCNSIPLSMKTLDHKKLNGYVHGLLKSNVQDNSKILLSIVWIFF